MRQNVIDLLMGGAGALVLSAAARYLPAPTALGSRPYAWFYHFANILLANFDKVQIGNDFHQSSH